ncbi:MAG: DegT/DnrJ/EryC1/StrS family aminotransferase [Armatimonadetes bacterium]|jgi:dTDP-4-amino-4,6-dideoxygalactose transaminase|nr:DegT/DnrJ/EryC1/StrS family aminotransferase [Armatimonadota bacterium]MDI9584276.1 DegT/DnrJ/EryC1/StrS family aminotransferase [Acidobacteriota bacterium]
MPDEKSAGDFRYSTGDAAVPWAAVGEHLGVCEAQSLLRFLARPRPGREDEYKLRLEQADRAISDLFEVAGPATKLSLGDMVERLERVAAGLLNCKHTLFLTNATHGFEIGFKYANLGPGDEVIAPSISFIATIAYPLGVGAKVVFADLDPASINMDPADVARKVTDRTRVIIPVHIGGYPVDMDPIMEIARERDIVVIEDAAHAFGGSYKGRMLGTIGDFGSFSFHEVKNITSFGEGGILATNSDWGENFKKARFLGLDLSRQIDNWLYDVVALPGKRGPFAAGNYSSTEIQAVCLLSQIARLESIIAKRRERAEYLTARFSEVEGLITPPGNTDEITPTWHLYLLQVDPAITGSDVQTFKAKLTEKGVTNIPHFGPMYKFDVCRQLGYDADEIAATCPVTEEVFNHRFTHLPLYPLTDEQVEMMADRVIEAVEEMKRGA